MKREDSRRKALERRTERAMKQKMCGAKIYDRRNTSKLVERLGLEETVVKVIKRSGLRWMGHVLRSEKSMGSGSGWHKRKRKTEDYMERHGEEGKQ